MTGITLQRKSRAGFVPAKPKSRMYQPVLAKPQSIYRSTSLQGTQPGLSQGAPSSLALASGSVDAGSGMVIGLIQALTIIVNQLSAITENVGTLIVNKGGSISSGQTAFNTGIGFWLGTDGSGNPQLSIIDQFGNSIVFDGATSNALSINSSGVVNVLSSKQVDDGGWSASATLGGIIGLPATANVTNATWASSVVTFTVDQMLFQSGMQVSVQGVSPSGYNGIYTITGTTNNTITAALASNPGAFSSAGTMSTTGLVLATYGITDAQPALPQSNATRQALFEDSGGGPYWANQYDTNVNFGSITLAQQTVSGTTPTRWGGVGGITNPGQSVNLYARATGWAQITAGSAHPELRVDYSLDGGSTWTSGQVIQGQLVAASTIEAMPFTAEVFAQGVTPTGDVQFRAMIFNGLGAETSIWNSGTLTFELVPVSNFYALAPLAASIPATASMNCTSIYPSLSCTANGTVKATPTGGVAPFSYLWAKVSGTGNIASGGSSQTVTLSDTENTTTGGATHTTTVNCAVTDSQSYATTAGSQSAGTATVTIGAHNIPVGATVNVSGCTPSNYNGTALVVTGITATQIKYAVSGSPGAITIQGTVNNVTVTTGNCVMTGTFTLKYAAISATITPSPGACGTNPCGGSCTANGSATANPSGGNGSYTYSWSVTSGGATIVSGGSSKTCNFHQTDTTTSPATNDFSTVKCTINDTRGTGAISPTASLKMTFSCPGT